ncbi:TetR/AcrR family transcriptional regulator [Bifidobacterium moraviense]|nr:TetR/AcrR family transcriptional regulator [Bifidobacterium sp. DSM 109958]
MTTARTAQPAAHSPSRGMRTREATDRKILRATMEIALQRGIAAVTIEEVARRSGVAKTTIYRRYSNAGDLLRGLRALGLPDAAALSFEASDPTRENLEALLRAIVERFRTGIGVKAVGMVLASDDEFFRHVVDEAIRPEQERCEAFMREGVRAGAFREGVDARFLFDTAIGSMVACEALDGGVDDAWPTRMAALIWPAIAA